MATKKPAMKPVTKKSAQITDQRNNLNSTGGLLYQEPASTSFASTQHVNQSILSALDYHHKEKNQSMRMTMRNQRLGDKSHVPVSLNIFGFQSSSSSSLNSTRMVG